jgi:hypothetical protein
MLLPIEALNSSLISSDPSGKLWTCVYTLLPDITRKVMAKLNVLTKLWNSTYEFTVTISKTIGQISYLSLSLLTIMLPLPLPEFHPSLPTKDITPQSRYTRNATLPLIEPGVLSLTLMNSILNFALRSPQLKLVIKSPQIPGDYRPRISR